MDNAGAPGQGVAQGRAAFGALPLRHVGGQARTIGRMNGLCVDGYP
jgi:hypothetical protein